MNISNRSSRLILPVKAASRFSRQMQPVEPWSAIESASVKVDSACKGSQSILPVNATGRTLVRYRVSSGKGRFCLQK